MLKDVLFVWLSGMLILLKSESFVIASSTLLQGSQNMWAMSALWHPCKVTHYELPFLQMKEA